jgi:hypothetical protein
MKKSVSGHRKLAAALAQKVNEWERIDPLINNH